MLKHVSQQREATLFQGAVEGPVLVKNIINAHALHKPKVLSLFGYDAPGRLNRSAPDPQFDGLGLLNAQPFSTGTPYTGLDDLLYSTQVLPAGFTRSL